MLIEVRFQQFCGGKNNQSIRRLFIFCTEFLPFTFLFQILLEYKKYEILLRKQIVAHKKWACISENVRQKKFQYLKYNPTARKQTGI